MRIHNFRLSTTLTAAACGFLLLAGTPLRAEEPYTIGTWKAEPSQDRRPVTFSKPPSFIRTDDYQFTFRTDPPTPQVGEPFTLEVGLKTPDGDAPLLLRDDFELLLLQRRGHIGAPVRYWESGPGEYQGDAMLPYSGGYILVIRFTPAEGAPVIQQVPLWIEGIAERGRDITTFPRPGETEWTTMPAATQNANQRVWSRSTHAASRSNLQVRINGGGAIAWTHDPITLPVTVQRADGESWTPRYWVTDPSLSIILAPTANGQITFPDAGEWWVWVDVSTELQPELVPVKVQVS